MHLRVMLREPDGRGVRGEISEPQHRRVVEWQTKDTSAYREMADPLDRVRPHSYMDKSSPGPVCPMYGQRTVARSGQFHCGGDDVMQRRVQVEVGADVDDRAQQMLRLVARCFQLVGLLASGRSGHVGWPLRTPIRPDPYSPA